jgi:hypothetical protein
MKKRPQRVGPGWGLNTRTMRGACSWEPKTRPVMHDLDPDAFPRLYKTAHFEVTMYKSNNSASGFGLNKKGAFQRGGCQFRSEKHALAHRNEGAS